MGKFKKGFAVTDIKIVFGAVVFCMLVDASVSAERAQEQTHFLQDNQSIYQVQGLYR